MSATYYIACDLGAESGRVMLGALDGNRLTLEEVHRFPNGPVSVLGTLRWDVLHIFNELKAGLSKIAARGVKVESLSCDSWGVDYVLLNDQEPMLTLPYHYRDARTDGALERAFAVVPADQIFAETGVQFMAINTLYQLLTDQRERPAVLGAARQFLNIGDYFNYLFSGERRAEESLASTTQMYDPRHHRWSETLLRKFELPRLHATVVASGTVLGPLLPALARETALNGLQVVAGCSHDTGCAVAAVPAEGDGWAYLSSGTWSLLGIERPTPIINDFSRGHNFTNEVGFGGSIRFLKNLIGLWIVQECRREWSARDESLGYEELVSAASKAPALRSLIRPDAPQFARPGDMPRKIADYCRETNQPIPTQPGEITRCALESLALLYRHTLDQIESLTRSKLGAVHIVGGGSRNELLNQFTANATGHTVLAGPAEATAIGNILIQATALGFLPDVKAMRQIVRDSFPVKTFQPQEKALWQEAYQRFQELPPT